MAANRRIHQPGRFADNTLHQCVVSPLDAVFLQLGSQMLMSQVIFGDHQQAGGVFVDAVNNAGTQHTVNAG